jgi:hypothetical protein
MIIKPWTDDEVKLLVQLWAEGFSASETARALQTKRSRNAIIGKLHRLGALVNARKTLIVRNRAERIHEPKPRRVTTGRTVFLPTPVPARTKAPVTVAAKPARAASAVESLNVSLLELQTFQCRAVTDATRFAQRFCGHLRADGSQYCAAHLAQYRGQSKEHAA